MHGKVNLGCLTLIALLTAGGYVGFKFGRVYMAKYFLDKKIFQIAGDAAEDWKAKIYPTERDIAEEVMKEAKNRSVNITYDDIVVARNDQTVSIKVFWDGDIEIPFYIHHFDFTFDHTRKVAY
jgi:hypothetical protein